MNKLDPQLRLTANNNGETKCIVFVDSVEKARSSLDMFVNTIVGSYPFISGFGAMVNIHRIDELLKLDCVSAISAHTTVHTCMDKVGMHLHSGENLSGVGGGENVTVAVIDSGIKPHLDFCMPRNRIIKFVDFIGGHKTPYDDNGHGTAVAGILCGNGLISGSKYHGIASEAKIVALKAIGESGDGGAFAILEAMQWVYDNKDKYNIKVVCMSFGAKPLEKNDPLAIGAEVLWKNGVTVVASAGNNGPEPGTIRSPGVSPSIITVGGLEYIAGKPKVPDFSSRGPCGNVIKPDVVIDAVDISCCGKDSHYCLMSGTSMSAPIAAGVCAAMISKYPSLTPDRIKELLIENAVPLGSDKNISGHGILNIDFLKENPL